MNAAQITLNIFRIFALTFRNCPSATVRCIIKANNKKNILWTKQSNKSVKG